MGFDFGAFFSDAGAKAQAAIDDALKVGVPVLQASAEQWGIDTLKKMQEGHQAEANQAIKEMTANDPAPGTFGAALSATIKGSVLETHGTQIMIGVGALIFLGFFLRGK